MEFAPRAPERRKEDLHRERAAALPFRNVLKIVPRYDLTMAAVLAKKAEGHEIVYTPHVGNAWREDIQMAQYGFTHANVNRNAIGLDDIDRPHLVRVGNENHEIVSDEQHGVLTPFARLDRMTRGEIAGVLGRDFGGSPAQIHAASRRAALPEGVTDFFDRYLFVGGETERRTADVLAAASRAEHCEVFTNRVVDGRSVEADKPNPNGERAMREFLDLVDVMLRNIETGETKGKEAPIPANSAMLAAMAVHALLSQRERGVTDGQIYTVSGPSMIHYMHQLTVPINAVYHEARKLHPDLPETVHYNIIPGAVFDFVPAPHEREAIELIGQILDLERRKEEIGAALRGPAADKGALVREKNELSNGQQPLIERFLAWKRQAPFISQYDLLRMGGGLQDIPELQGITFRRIEQLFHEKK